MRSNARVRITPRAALALSLAAACSAPRTPPQPPVPPALVLAVPPATNGDAGTGARAAASSAPFAALGDRVLAELFADDPTGARDLGLHEYDGKIAPLSREALAARAARLDEAAASLAAVDGGALSGDDALDLASLKTQVQTALFFLVDLDSPHKVPQFYESLFSVDTFIDREYAPLEERARRLLAHEEAALAEVGHARENLTPPFSKPVTEVAARNYAGFASYLRVDVARVMGNVGDEAQRARFKKANLGLAAAAADLAAWLKKEAARGDQSHVLGPQRYAKLLRVQEGITEPLDAFARMNEDDLAANKKAYEALAAHVQPKPVREADYFTSAARLMHDARAFVVSHAIVDLPSDDDAVVRETPAYKRWNAASLEMSGPFDTVRSAFYYLTLPDKAWPDKERQAYLGSMGDLLGTTVHEVYPGHFVQGRWQERAPTRAQRAADDYAFVEGWAHYCEQMMIEEGFGEEDPANRLAMLKGALLRNCRFAASVGIHTRGMTVEEAARRFVSDCHQDEATAREQAVRGTFDPGYFAYTLGKLQIIALRDEAKRALGAAFSLEKFHDALLAHGAPPLALLHDRVLRDLGVPTK
ncbi:MAG TPA: DUF885 domain-containing protein [Polyangiaceae bacterium]